MDRILSVYRFTTESMGSVLLSRYKHLRLLPYLKIINWLQNINFFTLHFQLVVVNTKDNEIYKNV
jgi:hypothetical protein